MSILTEIAVPYFFIISGFFFLNRSYYSKKAYGKMLMKKIKTLAMPFLIWNLTGVVFLWIIAPEKVGSDFISCLTNLLQSNWYGPLWYVRDLLLMMISIPIYNWIFIYNQRWVYILVLIITFYTWIPVSSSLLSSEGLFFFFIGGYISKNDQILYRKLPILYICFLLIIWICLSTEIISTSNTYLHKINTTLGITVFWLALDYLKTKTVEKLLVYAEYSFLFYVMHAYIMKAIKQGIGHLFFGSDIAALVTYIVLPLLTATIIYHIGKLWKKVSLQSYKIAIGGR